MKYASILGGLTILLLVAGLPSPATLSVSAQTPPDVKVKLTMMISDSDTWLAFRERLFAVPADTSRVATVTVGAATGGSRSIVLNSVKLQSTAAVTERATKLFATISGKMAGVPALRTLEVFERSFFQMQAGLIPNDVAMTYGTVEVIGQLTEVKVMSPADIDW
jgi:hypothetical protein